MQAGHLDQRVRVRQTTPTPDEMGGVVEAVAWGPVIAARVVPDTGSERVSGDRIEAAQRYWVTVRTIGAAAGLSAADILLWGELELEVVQAPVAGRAGYRTLLGVSRSGG